MDEWSTLYQIQFNIEVPSQLQDYDIYLNYHKRLISD